jgi:nucleoside-diphosphate-sugar epimerase
MLTLVVGTGYTGQRILPLLPNEAVIGISRSAIGTDGRTHLFDLDAPSPLPIELPREYGVIYTVPPAGHPPDQRLAALLERLRPAPSRFVYISTTGVYGDRGGAVVTEATPVHPENERSQLRVAAEELLRDWSIENRCKLVILRAPGIYGPGRLGIESLRAGTPVLREEDASPGNRIHVDDLAACCVAALAPAIPAGLYNVGDNDHRSSTWFSGEVARQAGLPPPREISREQAEHEFSVQRMSFLRESRVVDTAKMRDVLGVTPRYANPEDGIRASLS